MSEWWTYEPSDFLLFTLRTYYRLIELHKAEIWPLQLVALARVAILALLRCEGGWQRRAIAAIPAMGWAWVVWAFHLQHYECSIARQGGLASRSGRAQIVAREAVA